MIWTEIIHIRAHSTSEAMDIVTAFYRISFSETEKGLADISLLRNRNVLNDFNIRMIWQGDVSNQEKSPLGIQLAEAFSRFGMIYHSVWVMEASLFMMDGRNINEQR